MKTNLTTGPVSGVIGMVVFVGFLLLTAGANIRRFLQLWAVRRLITGTQLPAVVFLTELTTVNAGANRFCWTKLPTQTRVVQDTVIPVNLNASILVKSIRKPCV